MPDPDPSAAPAIRLTGLRKTYAAVGRVPAKEALKGVDLSLIHISEPTRRS